MHGEFISLKTAKELNKEKDDKNEILIKRINETKELLESLKVFWKKYTPDNPLEIGQIEKVIKTLDGVGSE